MLYFSFRESFRRKHKCPFKRNIKYIIGNAKTLHFDGEQTNATQTNKILKIKILIDEVLCT